MTGGAAPRVVVVLAAIIERGDVMLVTRRLAGTHLEGLWEFPGGKCEPGETHDACLRRELEEELGVDAEVGEEVFTTEHAYADRIVRLHFRRAFVTSEPVARLGQELRWMKREELEPADFPPADAELIEKLRRRD